MDIDAENGHDAFMRRVSGLSKQAEQIAEAKRKTLCNLWRFSLRSHKKHSGPLL